MWVEDNTILHKRSLFSTEQVIDPALHLLVDFKNARTNKYAVCRLNGPKVVQIWAPSTSCFLKLNSDATFMTNRKKSGMVFVIRNKLGHFVVAKTEVINGCLEVQAAEA